MVAVDSNSLPIFLPQSCPEKKSLSVSQRTRQKEKF